MAGNVRLTSEPGKGTTVVVRMTVEISEHAPDSELSCAQKATCCPVSKVGLRILVAEDNVVNQLMILKALEKLGHDGVCVQDGEEALERLRKEAFDCVLMDIQMPGLDGTDVTRLIRKRALPGIDPEIPIIALTAYALSGDRERFLAQGMNGYLAKPVSIADLPLPCLNSFRPRTKQSGQLWRGSAEFVRTEWRDGCLRGLEAAVAL
jgi:FOG: CheY-like receiver